MKMLIAGAGALALLLTAGPASAQSGQAYGAQPAAPANAAQPCTPAGYYNGSYYAGNCPTGAQAAYAYTQVVPQAAEDEAPAKPRKKKKARRPCTNDCH